jgi:prepilin-type N-terminal cleavage/methylation domain-containing protein
MWCCSSSRRRARGFTLIELAVVVGVIALLLGSILVPLGTQVNQRNIATTQTTLAAIEEAILGYGATNGRLPCPDTTGDGLEDRTTGTSNDGCVGGTYVGAVPWATLGVPQADAWNYRFKYRVDNQFTRADGDPNASGCAPGCTLQLGDAGTLNVNTRRNDNKNTQALAFNVPAVILSFGKNANGATNTSGATMAAPPASTDELTNATAATTTFISRAGTEAASPCSETSTANRYCEFDDLVTWVSPNILFNRLVVSGRLP